MSRRHRNTSSLRENIRVPSSTSPESKYTDRSSSLLIWILRSRNKTSFFLRSILAILFSFYIYRILDTAARYIRKPKYRHATERNYRDFRFPSVDDRVRLYMGHWYLPPCQNEDAVSFRRHKPTLNTTSPAENDGSSSWWWRWGLQRPQPTLEYVITEQRSSVQPPILRRKIRVPATIETARLFFINQPELNFCYRQQHWSIRFYCSDSLQSIVSTALPALGWTPSDFPVVCQFSDQSDSFAFDESTNELIVNPRIPHLKKIRYSMNDTTIVHWTGGSDGKYLSTCRAEPLPHNPQPILWFLNIKRHFKFSQDIRRYDIPWHRKRDQAIFRGFYTGFGYNANGTDLSNCHRSIRCRLVLRHGSSRLVDAKFTSLENRLSTDTLQGVNLTAPKLNKEELLLYKGQIMLEGNDVSSGLKWAMVSRSVVLMPRPRFTSWLMEERLEPWIHYIPLSPDLSDTEAKVQWMLDHEAEAQRISYRARLWILDLYFHPQAAEDDKRINAEILRRYRKHYREEHV